jgi:hypothetical protein
MLPVSIIIFITIQFINLITSFCPLEWKSYGDNCYNLFSTSLNHEAAQAFCPSKSRYSYLVEINSEEEFTWIQENFPNTFWVENILNFLIG